MSDDLVMSLHHYIYSRNFKLTILSNHIKYFKNAVLLNTIFFYILMLTTLLIIVFQLFNF